MWFLSAEQTASLVIATSVFTSFGALAFGTLWLLEMRERSRIEAERDDLLVRLRGLPASTSADGPASHA